MRYRTYNRNDTLQVYPIPVMLHQINLPSSVG